MKQKFERVILYARQHRANEGVTETLHRLISFLADQAIETYLDEETHAHFALNLPCLAQNEMGKKRDLIVVVGGDGSLLSAARMAIQVDVPVIGINRGRLGFLTDILPQEIETQLQRILQGQYQEEQRFLLQGRIHDDQHTYFEGDALNDVVLSRGNETHLVEFEVYINQQYVCHYRSDGLVISTPTGSTAYALSAGGPIMHPSLNAMVLVPLFSHSLSSRPLVIDGDANIDLLISKNNETNLIVSCDGHESHRVKQGQHVTVVKNTRRLRLLHPMDYHYYDTLRIKLGWQSKNNNGSQP
jgi:NAD+ kinase